MYFISIGSSMILLTVVVLGLIRLTYRLEGYEEYLGDYWEHFGIDLFGMIVYVSAATFITRSIARFRIEWEQQPIRNLRST